jgi:hypothetical protein
MEKFNVDLLKNGSTAKQYAERVTELLGQSSIEITDTSAVNDFWKFVKTCIISAADEAIGKVPQGRRKTWFDEKCQEVTRKKTGIYGQVDQTRTRAPQEEYGHLRTAERRTRQRKKRAFYNDEVRELESARREKAVRLLYQKVNATRQNFKPRTSKEGRLISDKEGVLRRWREQSDGILNKETIPPSEPSPVEGMSAESQVVSELTMEEVHKALHKMKSNKSPGIDTIPSELIRFGGESLIKRIHELIRKVRAHEKIPDECKEVSYAQYTRRVIFWNEQIIGAYHY